MGAGWEWVGRESGVGLISTFLPPAMHGSEPVVYPAYQPHARALPASV